MTDDLDAALDDAIRATGVHRYRWLCSDANTLRPPNSRDDWRRFILERRWERAARDRAPPAHPRESPDPAYLGRLPPLGGCCGGGG